MLTDDLLAGDGEIIISRYNTACKKAVLSETIIALLLMLSQYKAFSKLFELNQFLLLIVPMTIR